MNKMLKCLAYAGAAALALPGLLFAETLSGSAGVVDHTKNSFSLQRTNASNMTTENIEIKVTPDTAYNGIKSFQELKNGDLVEVDGNPGSTTGSYLAKSVTVNVPVSGAPVPQEGEAAKKLEAAKGEMPPH